MRIILGVGIGVGEAVKIGVVGVGRWGRSIVRALKELEDHYELTAVCDADFERAKLVAMEFGVKNHYDSVKDMFKNERLDAVAIATPIDKLSWVAERALEAGLHVFVEKPVATRSEEVERLVKLAESNGLVAMPGFIMRFDPVVLRLKEMIKGREILYMALRRLSYRSQRARRFSILLDLTIHDIDLARYLSGVEKPRLTLSKVIRVRGDEIAILVLDLDGKPAILHTDGLALMKIREIEILTEDSFIRADTDKMEIVIKDSSGLSKIDVSGEEALKRELKAFLKWIKGEKHPGTPTMQDACIALKIVEKAILESE